MGGVMVLGSWIDWVRKMMAGGSAIDGDTVVVDELRANVGLTDPFRKTPKRPSVLE